MANTKIITSSMKVENANNFLTDVSSGSYYVFAAKCTPYSPDDSTVPVPQSLENQAALFDQIAFGKKLQSADVSLMIVNSPWITGTLFDQYDQNDPQLSTKNFYCVTTVGSVNYVYKCLSNNDGTASTIIPSGTSTASFTSPNDGYTWKFMYSFSDAQNTKFSTTGYIPVTNSAPVVAAAVQGSIDTIVVDSSGSNYNNYLVGSFGSADIRIGGNPKVYSISSPGLLFPDFYTGCMIRMTSGSASGQYTYIDKYAIESGVRKLYLRSAFTSQPVAGDSYAISPAVSVTGDGNETSNCAAYAVINPVGNTISSVAVLSTGSGYRKATAQIVSSNSVGVIGTSNLRCMISPHKGHGANPAEEKRRSRR